MKFLNYIVVKFRKKSVSLSFLILFYFLYVGPHCVAQAVFKHDSPVFKVLHVKITCKRQHIYLNLWSFPKGLGMFTS